MQEYVLMHQYISSLLWLIALLIWATKYKAQTNTEKRKFSRMASHRTGLYPFLFVFPQLLIDQRRIH